MIESERTQSSFQTQVKFRVLNLDLSQKVHKNNGMSLSLCREKEPDVLQRLVSSRRNLKTLEIWFNFVKARVSKNKVDQELFS